MPLTLTCHLSGSASQYQIEIGSNLLNAQRSYLESLGSRFAIIADDITASLHGEVLLKSLSGLDVHLFSFPAGEKHKTRATKERLEDAMLEKGFGRDSCVIALGGGVVTDLAGFIAATYCRGLPLVMIPTSLMAMVDASLGGKTSVNTPHGKNMIGCLYRPKKIIMDISTLNTLPKKELVNGVVEIIKHGLIEDSALFNELERKAEKIMALEKEDLKQVIYKSCLIKKNIVEHDEKETGKRRLLNFGHTIGHALELLTSYGISHGEAVAIGLVVESIISVKLGHLDQEIPERIKRLLLQYGLPLKLPARYSAQSILGAMTMDKKSLKGRPRFVMIDAIGSSVPFDGNYCTYVDEFIIKEALSDALCCD